MDGFLCSFSEEVCSDDEVVAIDDDACSCVALSDSRARIPGAHLVVLDPYARFALSCLCECESDGCEFGEGEEDGWDDCFVVGCRGPEECSYDASGLELCGRGEFGCECRAVSDGVDRLGGSQVFIDVDPF